MITSKQQMFSEGQNVTADAASTNVIDLGATGTVKGAPGALTRDVGPGRPVNIFGQLDADAGGTTPTLDVLVQVDTVSNFASPRTIGRAEQIGDASAGERFSLSNLPRKANERYLRLYYDVGGTSPDYTITAGITLANKETL